MKFAQVVVNRPIIIRRPIEEEDGAPESLRERAFTYAIPPHLSDKITLGQLVWVPFGPRRIQGVVVAFSDTSPVELTKEIDGIADPSPLLSATQLDLARWITHTYLCSFHDAIKLFLPPGIEQPTEIYLTLPPPATRGSQQLEDQSHSDESDSLRGQLSSPDSAQDAEPLTSKQTALVGLIARDKRVNLNKLPRDLRSAVDALVRRGLVLKQTYVAPLRAKPKRAKSVRLISNAPVEIPGPRNAQADALEYLARVENIHRAPTFMEICQAVPCSENTLQALAKMKWIEIVKAHILAALTPKYFAELPALPPGQARIVARLGELGAPAAAEQIGAPAALRTLAKKGYIELVRVEAAVATKLTPRELLQHARELRGEDSKGIRRRYAAIIDFLREENRTSSRGDDSVQPKSNATYGTKQGSVWISAVYAATGCTRQDLKKLETAGLIALDEEELVRDSLAGRRFEISEPPKLTPEQESAWEIINSSVQTRASDSPSLAHVSSVSETFLLHGVTGSGKTEIYLCAIAQAVAQGKQAIALVPEIALTPQTIRRFGVRFKRMAVIHSKLSVGERYDTWRRCRDGSVDVVVGTRSALFAPLPNLGLIVLDEEHDTSYKQAETPHYHARETAIELARRVGATVILGSATPDLETYYRATRGEFKLLELPKRVMGHTKIITQSAATAPGRKVVREFGPEYPDARYMELPPVEIVDLRAELKAGNRSMFSRALQREMARVLAANEQVILFLNRRGSATFILCRDCGYVFKCKRCDNPLTFHGMGNELQCHHCGRRDRVPVKCPNCGSARIRYFGMGTEKVQEEIERLFPVARTLRWDVDVTRGKDSHEEILEKFVAHQADVMIGTQMIAKGLDLPLVTLVGVVSADTSLNLPDWRASERTFQLLTQVAGRAGRSILGGKVIVQTYNPDHYAIAAASRHDYHAFYEREISFRRELGYPPFRRLIRMLYAHASEARARIEAERLFRLLTDRIAQRGLPGIDLIGPAPAFFHRVRGEYRFHILVRGEKPHMLVEDIALPLGWRVDVDPVSVL